MGAAMRWVAQGCALAGLVAAASLGTGCAVATTADRNCTITMQLTVTPQTATADHNAAPPGNQVHFEGVAAPTSQAGCPVPQYVLLETAAWTNPDPADI